MISLAISFALLFQASGLLRVDTYLIPANLEPRWVTIEYENPQCLPLKEGASGQDFVIPTSGFLCTSSEMYMGWRQEKFYLVDEKGNQTLLKIDEQIFRRESLNVNEPSLDAGMPVCKVKAGEFFYGPKEKLTYNNPIMEDEAFLSKYHPECRNRGVVYKKRAN